MSRSKKQKHHKRLAARILKSLGRFLLILWILTFVQVTLLRFVNPPFTARTAPTWLRNRIAAREYEGPLYRWTQLNEISPHLRRAVLAGEDQRFLSHHGFDFVEINEAFWDILQGRGMRGASTITMQVARTVFLWQGRSWPRKTAEAYYTLLIEIFWDKKRILEVYLNTVDWGAGMMGAEAASRGYFHTSCARVTVAQAALLAAILPSPHKWSPLNPNKTVEQRQARIMRDMKKMPLL